MNKQAALAFKCMDLTSLGNHDTPDMIEALCAKASYQSHHVAAICVFPEHVTTAKRALQAQGLATVPVATVTNFPQAGTDITRAVEETQRAIAAGADEIDMVINRGAFLSGDLDKVADEITSVRLACGNAHLKIILETGELETLENVRLASDLAIRAAASAGSISDGEVFIKTSTGKVSPAATMPVTLVMLESIREYYEETGVRVGMKPAGGIRFAKQALHYLVMVKETLGEDWLTPQLFRFGASSLANDVLRQIVRQHTGCYAATYDFSEA